jgi:hypothetical protein
MISLQFLVVIAVSQVPSAEMRSEFRQSVGRLEKMYAQVQIEGVLTYEQHVQKNQDRPETLATETATLRYASTDGRTKLSIIPEPQQGQTREDVNNLKEMVFITDQDRGYELHRKLKNRDYVVYYAGKKTDQAFSVFHERTIVQAPFTIAAIPLSRLLDAPDFVLTSMHTETYGGKRLTRFDFKRPSPSQKKPTISGWFLVDPQNEWVVREYEIELKDENAPKFVTKNRAVIEYNESSPGKSHEPILVKVTQEWPWRGYEQVCQFQPRQIIFAPLAPKEFTLAAFGLGDALSTPDSMFKLPIHWVVFGVAFCFLCLRISIGAVKRIRRR